MNKKIIKRVAAGIGAVLLLIVIVFAVYVVYVFATYKRISDNAVIEVNTPKNAGDKNVTTGKTYTIGTYNVGFGAYIPEYSFFMDGGKYSRCLSREAGIDAINGAAALAIKQEPDFMIFEEVDTDATRSYHVNQLDLISSTFDDYYMDFAMNYDSAYLFYPFNEPIGKSQSGIAFYSKYEITSALRRSLPISTSVTKILDLDRCYSVSRIPVDNGKELIIYSVHLSAYGNSDEIRTAQTGMLFEDMKAELYKGNYVVCGGDFNHDLKLSEEDTENCESWAYPFPRSRMPEGLSFAMDALTEDEFNSLADSNRNTDIPYTPGVSFTCILDGFIISDNVEMTEYTVVDTGFTYADHQPVMMKFALKENTDDSEQNIVNAGMDVDVSGGLDKGYSMDYILAAIDKVTESLGALDYLDSVYAGLLPYNMEDTFTRGTGENIVQYAALSDNVFEKVSDVEEFADAYFTSDMLKSRYSCLTDGEYPLFTEKDGKLYGKVTGKEGGFNWTKKNTVLKDISDTSFVINVEYEFMNEIRNMDVSFVLCDDAEWKIDSIITY